MKYVKLFEEFTDDGQDPHGHNSNQEASKAYIYYINNDDEKHFDADIRDPDGKIIFELTASDLSNDGHMKGKDDVQGLRELLLSKNKIKQGDTIVPANSTAKVVGGQNMDFVPELNTNLNQTLINQKSEPE